MIDLNYWSDLICFLWLVRHGADIREINLFADFRWELIFRRNHPQKEDIASFSMRACFVPDIVVPLQEAYQKKDWKTAKAFDIDKYPVNFDF